MSLEDLEKIDAGLLIGSNVRKEQPLAALRLRKASLSGAKISFINPRVYEMNFEPQHNIGAAPREMLLHALAVAVACDCKDDVITRIGSQASVTDEHREIAEQLKGADNATVLLGNLSVMNPNYSDLRAIAACIAKTTGAKLGYLPEGGNTAGAWLAGCVPHRGPGGVEAEPGGLNAAQMLSDKTKVFLLMGVEPRYEQINAALARKVCKEANLVIISTHLSRHAVEHANIVLPSAAFLETAGTFVNATGAWQMFNGTTKPPGEGRPAWKILRVLGNELELEGFDYDSVVAVRDEIKDLCRDIQLDNSYTIDNVEVPSDAASGSELLRCGDLPAYKADMLVRRAGSLQKTADAQQNYVSLHSSDMQRLGLAENAVVSAEQNGDTVLIKVRQDDGIPQGCAWLPMGSMDLAGFGCMFEPVKLVADT